MKIEKSILEEIVRTSTSRRECFDKLKIHATSTTSYTTLNYHIGLYNLDIRHFVGYCNKNSMKKITIPLHEILSGKHPLYNSSKLRIRLIKEGIFEHRCQKCQLTDWNDKPIPLDLEHINGTKTDHTLENLMLLCRNCHAQTDTFCGKNMQKSFRVTKAKKQAIQARKQRADIIERDVKFIEQITNSNINFSKFGWCKKVSDLTGLTHQKVGKWMKTRMPEFYFAECTKRKTT